MHSGHRGVLRTRGGRPLDAAVHPLGVHVMYEVCISSFRLTRGRHNVAVIYVR